MNAHTPGPWQIEATDTPGESIYIVREPGEPEPIARVSTLADARLLAAAPDLYAALRAVHDAYSYISEKAPAPLAHAIRKARVALAKVAP